MRGSLWDGVEELSTTATGSDIRSTQVIGNGFATVRLRTYKTKGKGRSPSTLAMAFELIKEAERSWRKITRWQHLGLVREGRVFKDGELIADESAA